MKTAPLCVLLVSSLMSGHAAAQSLFDGTWKVDLNESQPSTAEYNYLLEGGTYRCTSCKPPLEVRADGEDHQITGEPCYDTVSLKVVNALATVETDKRNGKTVGTSKMTVSPDGNTATVEWTESCNTQGDVVGGEDLMARVSPGPRGAHAVSGSWRITKRMNRSENALVVNLKLETDSFSFADPTGQSYVAKLGGTETMIKGDLSNTMVSVRRIDEHTIEETDKRAGKIVEVTRFTVSADGMTITASTEDKSNGHTRQLVLHKQ